MAIQHAIDEFMDALLVPVGGHHHILSDRGHQCRGVDTHGTTALVAVSSRPNHGLPWPSGDQ